MPGRGLIAAVDAVIRNTPRRCFFITGSAYLAPSQTPLTFTAMMRSKMASSTCSTSSGDWGTPALAKKMSRVPHAASARSTIIWLSAARVTSARMARARPPAFSICSTVDFAPASFRSTTATRAPSRAMASAEAAPMPEPAPVITATLPSSLIVCLRTRRRGGRSSGPAGPSAGGGASPRAGRRWQHAPGEFVARARGRLHETSRRRGARLQLVKPRVETAAPHEIGVRALFVDAPVVKHEDPVGGVHRRETVRDRDAGAACEESRHRLSDERFGFRVDARHRFVQDENGRIVHEGPGDGQKLTLPVRNVGAALAQELAEPLRQARDEAGAGCLESPREVRRRHGAVGAQAQILLDGAREQDTVLNDDTDATAEARQVPLADVDGVHE